jgi:hypothetical protein
LYKKNKSFLDHITSVVILVFIDESRGIVFLSWPLTLFFWHRIRWLWLRDDFRVWLSASQICHAWFRRVWFWGSFLVLHLHFLFKVFFLELCDDFLPSILFYHLDNLLIFSLEVIIFHVIFIYAVLVTFYFSIMILLLYL